MPTPLSASEISDFRARLCAEAERQFAEHGVAAVSMRSLAKALGCSATTPYRYFKNKDEILAAVRAVILDRASAKLEAVGRVQTDAISRARAHTKAFVDFAFDEPNAYRLVYDLYQPDEAHYPELVRANARSVRVMTGYVEQLIAEGYLQGDPESLGYLYFAAVHGLIVLRMTGRPSCTREEFDRNCREILRLITRGVRAQATKSSSHYAKALEPALYAPNTAGQSSPD
ncbi:MAG: TetR/AcrR family transcriptional regulator [Cupriavidus necator]